MRYLIVNADDFGLTPGVNRAIIEAHTRGIVTSATLMANMPAFDEAVRLAKMHPTLGVGLHFNITQGQPISPPHKVRSLLDANGEFLGSSTKLAWRAAFNKLERHEILHEFRAQAGKLRDAGMKITHVDSHKHAHALPVVMATLQYAVALYQIGAMRLPCERVRWRHALRSPRLFKQGLTATLLALFCTNVPPPEIEPEGVSTDAFFGVAQTGYWSKDWLLNLLARLPDGVSELMCHPGYDDDALAQAQTRLRASREMELRLLTDPEIGEFVAAQNIELLDFGQLKPGF